VPVSAAPNELAMLDWLRGLRDDAVIGLKVSLKLLAFVVFVEAVMVSGAVGNTAAGLAAASALGFLIWFLLNRVRFVWHRRR
jgi:Zn-dependent protease with chaperone function